MRRVSKLLLLFEAWYISLFILSVLFIMPRYLSGGVEGGFVSLLRSELADEPEWESVIAFLFPVAWVVIPLSSIVLSGFTWLAWNVSFRTKVLNELFEAGGTVLLVGSVIPALLTLREVLLYEGVRVFGVFSVVMNSLNSLAALTRIVLDPRLIAAWGTIAVAVVIFVETAFFFGFFLPGDSLLVTIGILASRGYVDLTQLIPLVALAAIAGDQVNYFIGKRSGEALGRRYSFVARYMRQASNFYERHGGKAIVIARFIPVVRTFAPAAAGAARMRYRGFLAANVVGGVSWVFAATMAGLILGRVLPQSLVNNITLIVAVVIAISLLIPLLSTIGAKLHRQNRPDSRWRTSAKVHGLLRS